ncbi:hypothetical protein D3C75_834730 [compost metagenome]
MVEALGQAALHGQAERVEQVAGSEVALQHGSAVQVGDALLVQQLRCPPLALEADHHRFHLHQLADGGRHMRQRLGRFAVGQCALQRRMPLLQRAQ